MRDRLATGWERRRADVGWAAIVAVSALSVGGLAAGNGTLRIAMTYAGLVLVAGLGTRAGPGLIYALVVWTAGLGTLRRLLPSVSGSSGSTRIDPLLLVLVVGIVVLAVAASARGALRNRSTLATAVLWFEILVMLEAFNPEQGSLRSGLSGLVFVLVPTLAFWGGRSLCDDRVIKVLLRLLAVLSVGVAGYGLVQTFAGFPSWDTRWIAESGYTSLSVDKTIRAFGSASSAQEYALYLGIGFVVWAAYGLRPGRVWWAALPLGLTAVALVYESQRGVVVTTLFGLGLMVAARRGWSLSVSLAAGAALVLLLPVFLSPLAPSKFGGPAGELVQHQVSGLAHPLDTSSSTLIGHYQLVTSGFSTAVHYPAGLGISAVNLAGSKFGAVSQNTETDPSNVAVAMGFPGLLAYLAVVVTALPAAFRVARRRKDVVSAAAIGILGVTFLQWTNGGLYSVAFLPWLMMGWFDGEDGRARASSETLNRLEAAAP